MRRNMRLRPQTLILALQNLGYHRVHGPLFSSSEWKKQNFHVIILDPNKDKVTVNIHADVPKIGSSHRSRQNGKDIKKEFQRIKQEYKRVRGGRRTLGEVQISVARAP